MTRSGLGSRICWRFAKYSSLVCHFFAYTSRPYVSASAVATLSSVDNGLHDARRIVAPASRNDNARTPVFASTWSAIPIRRPRRVFFCLSSSRIAARTGIWSRAHSTRCAPTSPSSDIVCRCLQVDFSLPVSSRLSECGDSEDHHSGGPDAIEECIDRPGQVNVHGRGDVPIIEARDESKNDGGVDYLSRRDDAACVALNINHGLPVGISILEFEGCDVPKKIGVCHVDDLLMDCDLRPLGVTVVLVSVPRCEEIRTADRGQGPEADHKQDPRHGQPQTDYRKSIHPRLSSNVRSV